MRWVLVLLLSLFLGEGFVSAQGIVIESIGEKYNLNRKEIYRTIIDQKGFLWVTAHPGVFRFNGERFEEIGKETSLRYTTCYNITEDDRGRIWLLNDKNEVFKFENEKIEFVKRLNFEDAKTSNVYSLFVSNDSLIVSNGFYEVSIDCASYNLRTEKYEESKKYSLEIKDEGRIKSIYQFKFANFTSLELNTLELVNLDINFRDLGISKRLKIKNRFRKRTKYSPLFINQLRDGSIGLSWLNVLFLFDKEGEYRRIDLPIDALVNNVFLDSKGRYWVSVKYKELLCFDKDLNPINYDLDQFKGDIVTSVVEDDFGGLWFATYINGLKYCQNIEFKKHRLSAEVQGSELSNLCKVNEDNVLIGQNNGGVYKLSSKNDVGIFFKHPMKRNVLIKSLHYNTASGNVLCGLDYGVTKINFENKDYHYYYKFRRVYAYDLFQENDSVVIVAGGANVFKLNTNKDIVRKKVYPKKRLKSYCVEKVAEKEYWVGTQNGLVVFNGDSVTKTFFDNDTLNSRINKVLKVKDTKWMVTSEHGLVSSKNGKLTIYNASYGITDSRINCIYNAGDTNLWIGGDASLYKLILDSDPIKIERYDKTFGIPQGEIIDIASTRNLLWLNIGKSIYSVELDQFKPTPIKGKTHITKIVSNDSVYYFPEKIVLEYNHELNLNIVFNHLNFKRKDNARYRYRISNYIKEWVETQNSNVLLSALPPGEYEFELQSLNYANLWNPSKKTTIVITPQLWQSIWFRTGVFILIVVALYLLVIWRVNKVRDKESIHTQMAQLELKALKAQINPHFIFNSISSVQFYLSKNKPEKAAEYMQDFADLIRKVLNQSDNNLVSLESELKVIENYVKLESRKFRDDDLQLNYSISDQVSPREIQLPPTIIQPFVENAIWHGLKYKQGEKRIDILVSVQGDQLKICIEDNGVGRDKAKMFTKNNNRKSYGMTITANRIAVLNNTDGEHFKIEDLYTNDVPSGTRITLLLPFINTKTKALI